MSKILKDFFIQARENIVFFGTTPIASEIEKNSYELANLLLLNGNLKLFIVYESDSECFQQSLITDTNHSINRKSYDSFITHRDRISGPTKFNRSSKKLGLLQEIINYCKVEQTNTSEIEKRIFIRQINIRIPFCAILSDDKIWFTLVTNRLPTLSDYYEVPNNSDLYSTIKTYVDFCLNAEQGGIFLSRSGDELIQLYDREGFPRGIFPRDCFYTTKFKRYSIWGFVFNRKGELLLHQRSMRTKDGRGLWDKSTGGHVDLRDYSTYRTAQRELIEELFLPEAEFSKYIQAYLKDIIIFGDWNTEKRYELSFKNAFEGLDDDDWILFRPTDNNGDPWTVDRESQRRVHLNEVNIVFKPTVFISDVFFFIAPKGYIDNEEQMRKTFELSEKKGAYEAHKLISIADLRDWIELETNQNRQTEVFTDDLIFINKEFRGKLEKFSEFIKFIFKEE